MTLWDLIHRPPVDRPYYSTFRAWLRWQLSAPGFWQLGMVLVVFGAGVVTGWCVAK